jgi:hypothetical protein
LEISPSSCCENVLVPFLSSNLQRKCAFKKILAPVDPKTAREKTTKAGEHEDLICRKVLDISTFMARIENSHLDIFHCWFLPGETLLASGRTRIDSEKLI